MQPSAGKSRHVIPFLTSYEKPKSPFKRDPKVALNKDPMYDSYTLLRFVSNKDPMINPTCNPIILERGSYTVQQGSHVLPLILCNPLLLVVRLPYEP